MREEGCENNGKPWNHSLIEVTYDMATCTRNVRVDEDDNQPYRKCSTATIRSEGTGTQYYSKHGGIQHMYDSSDTSSLDSFKSNSSCMRIRRVSSSVDGSTRFPRLQECAHFHYDVVELIDFYHVFLSSW